MPFGRPKWGLISVWPTSSPTSSSPSSCPTCSSTCTPRSGGWIPRGANHYDCHRHGSHDAANTVSTLLSCEAGSESDLYRVQRAWVFMGCLSSPSRAPSASSLTPTAGRPLEGRRMGHQLRCGLLQRQDFRRYALQARGLQETQEELIARTSMSLLFVVIHYSL